MEIWQYLILNVILVFYASSSSYLAQPPRYSILEGSRRKYDMAMELSLQMSFTLMSDKQCLLQFGPIVSHVSQTWRLVVSESQTSCKWHTLSPLLNNEGLLFEGRTISPSLWSNSRIFFYLQIQSVLKAYSFPWQQLLTIHALYWMLSSILGNVWNGEDSWNHGNSTKYIILMQLFLFTARSSTFVDSCDFEEQNICGMIQGPGKVKWEQRSYVRKGPKTDFTNMGQCKGDNPSSQKYIMVLY